MDTKKILITLTKSIIASLALVCLLSSVLMAQGKWVNFSSGNDVRRLKVINDTLWAATSGGLLAITSETSKPAHFQINDGLGTNDLYDITVDADGQKWLAGYGRLVKFSPSGSTQFLVRDIDDKFLQLYTVVDDGDHLWIGCEIGLILFSKTLFDGQIQDSYTLFGNLNSSPAVFDIAFKGDSIWLGTASGLAVADRSNPSLLKAPANWVTFDVGTNPELGSDAILNVVLQNDEVYVTSPNGLFQMIRSTDTTFSEIAISSDPEFASASIDNDTIFYSYRQGAAFGFGFLDNNLPIPLPITGTPAVPVAWAVHNSDRWFGFSNEGLYNNSGGDFERYEAGLLPGNSISDITIDRSRILTAGLTSLPAVQYSGSDWKLRSFFVSEGTTDIVLDSNNNAWCGTRGNGLWLIQSDTVIRYDETNSTLIGNNDGPPGSFGFVFVNGLVIDDNFLFVSCYKAATGYPVAFVDLNDRDNRAAWDSLGVSDSILDIFTVDLDYHDQTLAVATEDNGVYSYFLGPNPYNRSDDSVVHFTENAPFFLISNEVTVVKYAPNGELWVGTNLGLNRFDLGVEFFLPVDLPSTFGSEISAIEFDGRGAAWIGSANGLVRIDQVTQETIHYTSLNSGLVSDDINAIHYDNFSGRLYVATNGGISYLASEIGIPTDQVDQVIAFPNPFVIDSDDDRVGFNFNKPARLNIFNAAGERIIDFDLTIDGWDGRNQQNEEVASGVYIFVLIDLDGNIGRGKILLVRE